MPNPKKRSNVDQVRSVSKRKSHTASCAAPDTDTNTNDEASSSDVQLSDSENLYTNDDDVLQLGKFQEELNNVQRVVEANKKNARDFEACVEQHEARILTTITLNQRKIDDERKVFETAFLAATISALQPMSVEVTGNGITQDAATKIKTSVLAAHDVEIFDYSEQLCKNATQFLKVYSDLAKCDNQGSRIATMRGELAKDEVGARDLIKAGAKRTRQRVLQKLAKEDLLVHTNFKLSQQEMKHAQLFDSYGSGMEEPESDSAGLRQFTRELTSTVTKIEKLVMEE